MLKVIIIDDENRIVEMIRHLIDWEAMGFDVIGTAFNGPDAFALVEKYHPDVVVSDVRMPGYDGIELIRRCHDASHYPHFIIISGYRFFEYAHNALRYGVEHYLLKPLDKNELIQALEIIKQKYYSEVAEEHVQEAESAPGSVDGSRLSLRRRFAADCISAARVPGSLAEVNRTYATAFSGERDALFNALYIKLFSVSGTRINLAPVLNRTCEDFPQYLDGVCLEHLESPHETGILCILNYSRGNQQALEKALQALIENLQQRMEMFGNFSPVFALGKETGHFDELPAAITSACTAALYSMDVSAPLIRYTDFDYSQVPIAKIYTPEISRLLLDAVAEGEQEQIRKYYNLCLSRIQAIPRRCPSILYDFIRSIRDSLLQYTQSAQLDNGELGGKLQRLSDILDHRCTESELTESALLVILEISGLISRQHYLEYSKPIRIARKYIDEHYMEQLTLDELADMVHLSSSYLSTVFKEETGLGFSDYLINCRISAAKDLLRTTDKSLPEIAEAIGYKDSKHFGKLFKKIAGIKPTDFRKLYS